MYHSGIGGGGFMVVRDAKGDYEAIDFRESAPAAAFEDMYRDNVDGSKFGGLSAGVPSEVAGLEYAHRKYGVRRTFPSHLKVSLSVTHLYLRPFLGKLPWRVPYMWPETGSKVCKATIGTRYATSDTRSAVSEDLVKYSELATKDQDNFLVNDPVWAEDFAPNGQFCRIPWEKRSTY